MINYNLDDITIVLPCYNEGESLVAAIEIL